MAAIAAALLTTVTAVATTLLPTIATALTGRGRELLRRAAVLVVLVVIVVLRSAIKALTSSLVGRTSVASCIC